MYKHIIECLLFVQSDRFYNVHLICSYFFSYLCFERMTHALRDSDRISIPLENVVQVKKAKPFAVLPGSGMSIEITCSSGKKVEFLNSKTYVFKFSIFFLCSICLVLSWVETRCTRTYLIRAWCLGFPGALMSPGLIAPRVLDTRTPPTLIRYLELAWSKTWRAFKRTNSVCSTSNL